MGEKSRMNKVLFFTDVTRLFKALEFFDISSYSEQTVPVKLHMGETGNKFFPKPDLARQVVDSLKKVHAKPFLFDTTVAYSGARQSKTGYLKLAASHGFTIENVGCSVVIDDSGVPTSVEGRLFDVAEHLAQATHIFALTHVKGHIQSGMGGAIKNFGMGGVTKETKVRIHRGSRPLYRKDACTFCGVCAEVCPFDAIHVENEKWDYDNQACFGCGVCVESCNSKALVNKEADLQYLLACSAKAVVQNKKWTIPQ